MWPNGCGPHEETLTPDSSSGHETRGSEQALCSRAGGFALRRGQLRRGRAAGQRAGGQPGRRRGHRTRAGRGPARADRCERSQRQGWIVGLCGREDHPDHRGGAARRAAAVLVRRFRRSPDHRSGRSISRPTGCRPDLSQPGGLVGQGAADLLPFRTERSRRRLHTVVL